MRLSALPEIGPGVDDWYVNLLWFERRKCLLLSRASASYEAGLRGRENGFQACRLEAAAIGERDDDLALALKDPARVHDCDRDHFPVRPELDVVPLR